jgi:hypothetical protein
MNRGLNTNKSGSSWSEDIKKKVFSKGTSIIGLDSSLFREDVCGNTIRYSSFGDRGTRFGWEIDHINPVSNGGGDELINLNPLQWKNNLEKGDKLNWK